MAGALPCRIAVPSNATSGGNTEFFIISGLYHPPQSPVPLSSLPPFVSHPLSLPFRHALQSQSNILPATLNKSGVCIQYIALLGRQTPCLLEGDRGVEKAVERRGVKERGCGGRARERTGYVGEGTRGNIMRLRRGTTDRTKPSW